MTDSKIDKFRFGVFSEGKQRSSLWVATINGNDLYVGARVLMNRMKVSIHGSGVCQVAFANEYLHIIRERRIHQPSDRTIVRWRRPATPASGAVCVASIRFPTDWLRGEIPQVTLKRPVTRFEAAPAGNAIEVGFFYSSEEPDSLEGKFKAVGQPLLYSRFPSGEIMSIVSRAIPFDAAIPPHLRRMGTRSLLRDDILQNVSDEMSNLSMTLVNDVKVGQPLIITQVSGVSVRREQTGEQGQQREEPADGV